MTNDNNLNIEKNKENVSKKVPELRFQGFVDAWEQRKLDKIVDVHSGRDYKHLNKGNIPVYGTGGYMLSVSEALSEKNDAIGIGRKGTIDKPYLLKAPFWTVDTLFYATPQTNNDLQFTLAIFKKINWKKYDESTGVPSLSKKAINNISAFLPSFKEQEKIGSFFQQLDDTITLHQRKLDKLKRLKQGYLQQLFPKNDEKVPRVRFTNFDKEWKLHTLGDVAERFDNLRVPITASDRISGATPYYGANGIQDYVEGHTHDGEFVLVAEDGANDFKNYPVQYVNGKVWVNNHTHVLQGRHELVDNKFLMIAIKNVNIEPFLVGGGRAKLNANIMMKLELLFPNMKEQQEIGTFFKQFDSIISFEYSKIDKLNSVKQALLQKMFI
ncbi:restriction endonuclease subunit S [Lactococcus lactis]|uniref:restriction endonuclease subunit S n=1 Tax=Lactococcus lactis TaxID=1358 RepID=UPI0038783122